MSSNVNNSTKYYNEALAYYLFLELGSKEDFDKEINEHGFDYVSYYYDESYEDNKFQASNRGNVYIPVAI